MALVLQTFNIGALEDSQAGGKNYISGKVYNVYNENDTLADIYSDINGTTPIAQDGIQNVSNSWGEVNFYIEAGNYYITVDSRVRNFTAGLDHEKAFNRSAIGAHDEIYSRTITMSQAISESSDLDIGVIVFITDRNCRFEITTGETPNTFDIIDIGNSKQLKKIESSPSYVVDPFNYGAKPLSTFDSSSVFAHIISTNPLQYPILDFGGQTYYGKTPISSSRNMRITNGVYEYYGSSNDIAIIDIGDINGDSLVRGANVDNFRARVRSGLTNSGLVGFRLKGLVRSSSIKNCVAEMFDDVTGSRNHIGFEMLANRIAASTAAGLYENNLSDCTALFAANGLVMRTEGTDSEARLDPQCNGNTIKGFNAFSCRRRAVLVGFGAQENKIQFRADTFPSQIGQGGRIDVLDLEGNYNEIEFSEEIGSRADTQYSIRLGNQAIYNEVNFSTQQVVTGTIDDSPSPIGKRAKNLIRQKGAGLIRNLGASEFSVSIYEQVPAAQTQSVIKTWIAPARCVVSIAQARLDGTAPTGGDSRVYFAKNSAYSVSNRVTWSASEPASVKQLIGDTSASLDINERWVLEPMDRLVIAADTPSGGGVTVNATFSVKII